MPDDLQPPPPARRGESAAEFAARERFLCAINAPHPAWRERHAADIAYTLEALGVGPDDFERVLRLAHAAAPNHHPAGLQLCGYRFGVAASSQISGEPLGVYLGLAVVAWTRSPT